MLRRCAFDAFHKHAAWSAAQMRLQRRHEVYRNGVVSNRDARHRIHSAPNIFVPYIAEFFTLEIFLNGYTFFSCATAFIHLRRVGNLTRTKGTVHSD